MPESTGFVSKMERIEFSSNRPLTHQPRLQAPFGRKALKDPGSTPRMLIFIFADRNRSTWLRLGNIGRALSPRFRLYEEDMPDNTNDPTTGSMPISLSSGWSHQTILDFQRSRRQVLGRIMPSTACLASCWWLW
jgi:hypothetical protein